MARKKSCLILCLNLYYSLIIITRYNIMKSENNKYKVLVVEDDSYSSELMTNWIAMKDELILSGTADCAAAVIEKFDLSEIDLIMLDIKLPDMTGMELLDKYSEIPFVIFTTAYEDYAARAFDIGAVDYLVKPISFDRFDKAIKRFIEFSSRSGDKPVIEQDTAVKYKKSSLEETISGKYAASLELHMKNDKPYLDPEITLQKLSENLKIPQHHLSQIINEKLKTNYYAFLSAYRVEEAVKLMHEPVNSNKTLIEISMMAGFQSKSVFNKIFKEITGFTPKEYRDRII